jgi:hypothetical protein
LLDRWDTLKNPQSIAHALETSIRDRIGVGELGAVAGQLGSKRFLERFVHAYRQRTTGV